MPASQEPNAMYASRPQPHTTACPDQGFMECRTKNAHARIITCTHSLTHVLVRLHERSREAHCPAFACAAACLTRAANPRGDAAAVDSPALPFCSVEFPVFACCDACFTKSTNLFPRGG
jgi:hypothetical protein